MAELDLMALYWTVSGPVDVHYGREWSTFAWRARCAEAARAGFSGIGLWHADVEHQLETRTLREIKTIFDGHGLQHLQLEFLQDFFMEPGHPLRVESDKRRKLLFEAANELDAHDIKVGNIPGTSCPLEQVIEGYAQLCDEAVEHFAGKVGYEPIAFDVNVNTLDAIVALAEGAEAPNAGLVIDTWHMGKLGIAPSDLRRLQPQHLAFIELSDGLYEDMPDRIDECINHRRLPGEGEFELPAYVAVCRELGYEGPWGVEVLSNELRTLPIEDEFRRAYETTLSQVQAGVAA